MTIFPRSHVQDVILDSAKTITSSYHISKNVARQDLKFRLKVPTDLISNGFFQLLKICRENIIEKILQWPVLDEIRELAKTLTSSDNISENIVRQDLKFGQEVQIDSISNGFFLAFEPLQRKRYSKNSTMTCLEQRNLRIQGSDIKCYETSSQKDRKHKSKPQK